MEEATIALEAELSTGAWTDLMPDVLLDAGRLHLDYGIKGGGPNDRVASTGTLQAVLDNRESNSGLKRGYYTPTHADCRSGFDESTQVRTKFGYGALYDTVKYDEGVYGETYFKWRGRISGVQAQPGYFADGQAAVQAVDWMDQAAVQRISQIAIQTSKRIDQLLPYVLADMPIQPRATSYATGVVTFSTWFNTDTDEKMSPMAVLQKMARNEPGYIYLKGDTGGGETLCFESRNTRTLNVTAIVTLSEIMDELEVSYARENVFNLIKTRIYPLKVDAAATTVLYTSQKKFSIAAGQSITIDLSYRDPTTGQRISATEVVTPLVADTDYKFGSSEGTANDLNASLGISLIIGGNTTRATFTNNAGVLGYMNLQQLRGKGISAYDPQVLESKNQTSIDKRGELTLSLDLEQIDSPVEGQARADYEKNLWSVPTKVVQRVRFLANKSAALMIAALQGEPGSRFRLVERMTAIATDYFINAVELDVEPGGWIWCTWIAVPADTTTFFTWNTSRWNVDTYWAY